MTDISPLKSEDFGTRICTELGALLFVHIPEKDVRIECHFIGMLPSAYIIVHTPATSHYPALISEGDGVTVRFVSMGNVYGFRTEVLATFIKRFNICFLTYPEKIEIVNLRRHPRIKCYIPARVHVATDAIEGVVSDISVGGIRFIVRPEMVDRTNVFQVGTALKASFPLLGIEGEKKFDVTLRNMSHEHRGVSFGFEFVALKPEYEEKIRDYIQSVTQFSG